MYSNVDNMPSAGYINPECFQHGVQYAPLGDLSGEDRSVEIDVVACQMRCKVTTDCAYFSFWPDGGCHLQSSAATTRSADAGVVAGPRRCDNGNDDILYKIFKYVVFK